MSETEVFTVTSEGPAGLLGFRPVADIRTVNGRQVRPGLLYRSATPQFVSAADAREFSVAIGLKSIIDLRLGHEVATEGSGGFSGDGVSIVNIPFAIRKPVAPGSAVAPMTSPDPLVGTYLNYLTDPESFRTIVDTLLEPDALPALVHCTVGKDRTGVAVAILLDALGALRSDIAANYAARSEDVGAMMERLFEMESYGAATNAYPPEAYLADPATMLRFLAWVDIIHGGSHSYLVDAGVSAEKLDELSGRLLITDDGPATTQILRSVVVPVDADEAWSLVGDTGGVHRWVPGLADTAVEDDARTATFDDGSKAREQIVAHSDSTRSYTYRYLDGPIPLDSYESTITVGPHHDGIGSIVVWNATLQATNNVVDAVEGLYDGGIARLCEIFDAA